MTNRRNRNVPPQITGTKVCSRCGKRQRVDRFYARRYTYDGLMAECKACNDARPRAPNPAKTHGHKMCSGCNQTKPLIAFAVAKTGKHGRHCYCRDCDAIRRKVARYRITLDEYRSLAQRAANSCECCRVEFLGQSHIYLDHCGTAKRVRGLLCQQCNSLVEKGDIARLQIIQAGQAYLQDATHKPIIPEGKSPKSRNRNEKSMSAARTKRAFKTCPACGTTKRLGAFYRNKRLSQGRGCHCKSCVHNAAICRRYGLSLEQYVSLIERAAGRCESCGRELGAGRYKHVDHCDTTGAVRGMICRSCNIMLGFAKHDLTILTRAIGYITDMCLPLTEVTSKRGSSGRFRGLSD